MIQNLNQVSFQKFGTLSPSRGEAPAFQGTPEKLHTAPVPVRQAQAPTRIFCQQGLVLLCVSQDGESYQDFYLDRPVVLHPGIWFFLTPFQGDAQVFVDSPTAPKAAGNRPQSLPGPVTPQLHIRQLFTFFYQEKEQGFLFSGESHSMPELTYVDQGTLHSVADGQDLLLQQGDLVIYGPDQWHMQYADMGVAPRFVTISFDPGDYDLSALIGRKHICSQQVTLLLRQMLREQERMDSYSQDLILSYLSQLLLTLLRETATQQPPAPAPLCSQSENEIIRRAQQYVSTHIRSRLSVPMVAKNADVSPSYLTALFHKHLQISPGEYIRRIKLQESKQMIREGNMNFTQIAAELQYSTIHHFSRQFKEKFGLTPTQYAKSVR